MARLVARGKYLFDGERKFYARGVSYGPFAPNSRGERYPEPERADQDFAMMRELGANLVRVYVPPPPWMFELAGKHGLRLMVGMPWPFHMAFLDSRDMTRDIRETIRKGVTEMRQFADVIFAYSLGNEVRSDIVRWHGPRAVSRFLAELYDLGKQIDPEGLFTYSNYPSAEYLELGFLDVLSFNVYLHREADFRRYMTHLLALSRDRPLVLSETGMDTIREGEEHQAELLSWQARAAFELGLSGFVVFAFTDEWHTGGAEITEWAFGLVTRERKRKQAFGALGAVFRGPLPPALRGTPRASVVVPAYNAAATLPACLASIAHLNYPDYETIVVDDGSTDSTADIAKSAKNAGIRTLRLEHRGLAAARNAGLEAATGRIVAFIDADAEADSDWLYHLVETIIRCDAEAAGGQNFPPGADSMIASAIAAAPGEPREVRMGADKLAQLCGCSMAVEKSKFDTPDLFDPQFDAAGDDVDFSWRMRDRGLELAYAPGAIAIHKRRATIRGYLHQQRGYGRAEGLLFRKYPRRSAAQDGLYGGSGWLAAWFSAGPRVYYGAFGRGLFQTLYPGAALPLAAQLPLTWLWVDLSIAMIVAGALNRFFGVLGCAGIILTIASACAGAAVSARALERPRFATRVVLALLWLLGPLVRSYERERIRWSFRPDTTGAVGMAGGSSLRGMLVLTSANTGNLDIVDLDPIIGATHATLVRRGVAVITTDGYQSYDLEIIVPPALRVPILFLRRPEGIVLGWRVRVAPMPAIIIGAALFVVLMLGGLPLEAAIAMLVIVGVIAALVALARLRRVPGLIAAAAAEVAARYGLQAETMAPGERMWRGDSGAARKGEKL